MNLEKTRPMQSSRADEQETQVLAPRPAADGIPPNTLLVNTYRVERLLGGGGMGEVYLARHAGLGTEHAVKVIRPSMGGNAQVMDLFYREAKVLRGVRHDAVVNYDGFVRDDQGRDYLVMEYVEGAPLSERLKHEPLTVEEVLTLRDRLCAGLAEAHRKGAVHRDLSPDNVILPGDRIESAKLIDFGLCKLTDPGQETIVGTSFAGKYRYASPEQFGLYGGVVDARSDIYSLGLLLAAALGRPLEMGESFAAALRSRQNLPDLSAVPAALRDWLTAMLQPDPAARPASVEALLERWPASALLAVKDSAEASKDAGAGRIGSGPATGRRWLVPAIVLILLLGMGASLYWVLRPLDVPRTPTGESGISTAKSRIEAGEPAVSKIDPVDREPDRPATPAMENLEGLIRSDRLEDAFALIQARLASDKPPTDQIWALAERLRAAGKIDPAFALIRVLATDAHGPAAFALAEFYDPLLWSDTTSPFSRPNAEKARDWYRRAAELGVAEAGVRLEAMQSAETMP
ncbi:serine/threonine-protein kinase [Thiocystis violascens]|uniref:Serine/threonine protein kinase n=1 Tax=Thiocystis violascens (strain ATCC 17096 / DSM 198 / 6111) TaxID=765911 RepID=I3YE74_THIV6|nr:serine/threonine-protein kinase [Thiocystis violascens]AFL75292.1 serine/threonine protein kinase [Thiocystis violascens DSM 198]